MLTPVEEGSNESAASTGDEHSREMNEWTRYCDQCLRVNIPEPSFEEYIGVARVTRDWANSRNIDLFDAINIQRSYLNFVQGNLPLPRRGLRSSQGYQQAQVEEVRCACCNVVALEEV